MEFVAFKIMVEVGRRRSLITYSQLSETVNLQLKRKVVSPFTVSRLIRRVCFKVYPEFKVFPGSVVVNKETGMPSRGYFKFLKTFGITNEDKLQLWLRFLNEFYGFCEVVSEKNLFWR
jgi:hypothetical protein